MRHVRAFKRALNHLSHLHAFPTLWQMVQDVSFLKVCCRLPGTTCDSASFLQTGFLPAYTPGRGWNNSNSLNLWDMESSGISPECITAEIIKKNLRYITKDLLHFATKITQNPKINSQPSNTKSTSLHLPVLLSIYLSHAALVKMIFQTSNSRNHNREDKTLLTILKYSSFTHSSKM